jgi:hypothetical protein
MKVFTLSDTNNKGIVVDSEGIARLTSYTTEVATYNHSTKKMKVNGYYSPTTMKHINAFFVFYGVEKCTKKELEQRYLNA